VPRNVREVGFEHRVRVRYGECDMQGVVFNAHYLAFIDDATDTWFRTALAPGFEEHGYDIMLKKAVVEWQRAARFREQLDLACSVSRWGNSSFDVAVSGTVAGEPRFTATITYVCVHHGTTEPLPVPAEVRAALDAVVVAPAAPA
jgi:acyl-CoA thioester hydrolase